jgi:uncharacterized membrane protein
VTGELTPEEQQRRLAALSAGAVGALIWVVLILGWFAFRWIGVLAAALVGVALVRGRRLLLERRRRS